MLYKELKKIIELNNEEYFNLNLRIAQIEEHLEKENLEETAKLRSLKHRRWQHIHNYATEISDLLVQKTTDFTKTDLSMLDLIPYIVWNKMTEKSILIVKILTEKL